jgi:hypothetical protein
MEDGSVPGCHGRQQREPRPSHQGLGVVWVLEVVQRRLDRMPMGRLSLLLLEYGGRPSDSNLPVRATRHILVCREELRRRGQWL